MQVEEKIKQIIEERIRPALQQDGGDIEFVELDGKTVKVRLQGACQGCPAAHITLQHGVKHTLCAAIPEIEEVVAV